jgi:diguanylate cyclase (GGDEF)-like protein
VTPRLRLLLIEDSAEDAAAVVSALASDGYDVEDARVDTPAALADALDRQRWDLAVANHAMPSFSGVAALRKVRERDADLPFIFVSAHPGEEAAVEAMRAGAHDYVLKNNLARLASSVARELREAAARRERRRAEQRLVYLAYHDALTDLPNRMLLQDRLDQATRVAIREGTSIALLVLDIDGFKEVNDALGHHAGDRVLQHVASQIRGTLRDADTVARLGADEFAILLPFTDTDGAVPAAQKVLQEVGQPVVVDRRTLSVRASLGIACFPVHGATAEVLMQKADAAMYRAKSDGGGGVAVYDPQRDRQTHRRLALVSDLLTALDENQFELEYQPILHLRTGTIAGVEALVRWNHPRHGRVQPADFIDLAEQTGLINPLTSIVLNTAIREWSGEDAPPPTVAVNLTPRTLLDPDLPQRIADMLAAAGAAPASLTLEITEHMLMSDPARSLESLKRLHAMGVRLTIDDFGTGYSSLSYLRRLPIDELKIDRSFVTGLASGQDEVIVRSTIDLAHNMGLSVVAEGVESEAVQAWLMSMGCDAVQGSFISAPGGAAAVREWMARQRTGSL